MEELCKFHIENVRVLEYWCRGCFIILDERNDIDFSCLIVQVGSDGTLRGTLRTNFSARRVIEMVDRGELGLEDFEHSRDERGIVIADWGSED